MSFKSLFKLNKTWLVKSNKIKSSFANLDRIYMLYLFYIIIIIYYTFIYIIYFQIETSIIVILK